MNLRWYCIPNHCRDRSHNWFWECWNCIKRGSISARSDAGYIVKNFTAALGASALTIFMGQSAIAADLGSLKDEVPVVAPAPTWSGYYFGASGGYGHNRSKNNYYDDTPDSSSVSESADGGLVSLVFGVDHQIRDRFVVGVFADIDWSDIDRGSLAANNHLTISRGWAIGGRLGYLVSPRMMLFGTAGFTQAHFHNYGWWDIETFGPTLDGRRSKNFNGYFIGGGLEVMLGSNFFMRGEVRYADYGEEVTNSGDFFGTNYVDKEDPEIITTRLGIVYKIGRDHGQPAGGLKDGGYVEPTIKVVTINGVDVAEDWYGFYSANYFALSGDFDRDGLIFRTSGLWGRYDYPDAGVPGTSIDATDRSLDVMLGYQKVFGGFSATVYAGYEVRDVELKPDDPTNSVRATQDGFKVAFDLETADGRPVYFAIDSSYSTAFDTFYGQARLGYNFGRFILGPEFEYYRDDEDESERVGAFLSKAFTVRDGLFAEFTVNGGYQFVDDNGAGGRSGSRGGEGGYVGSAMKFAF